MNHPWPLVPLGEVLKERREVPEAFDLASGKIRIVAKIGFNEGKIELRSDGETRTNMILIRPGDLVLSGINAGKGAIAIYDKENPGPVAATIHYGAYIVNEGKADIRYLWWLLRSKTFRAILLENLPGGIKTELKSKRLLPIPVLLPPLSEQQRLLVKIEELVAKIDKAQGLRYQAIQEIDMLSSGAITSLLAFKSVSMVSIEELVGKKNLKNGLSAKVSDIDSNIKCLRLSALRNGRIGCTDSKSVILPEEKAIPYLIKDRQVFIMRGNGSKDLVGRAGMVVKSIPGTIYPDLFIHVPLDENRVIPEFFVAWWNSKTMREGIENAAKTTSGIWKINQGHIASFSMPIPPIDEQRRIVAYLDSLQAQVNALKKLQAQTATELDALLPAILDRAFKGEL